MNFTQWVAKVYTIAPSFRRRRLMFDMQRAFDQGTGPQEFVTRTMDMDDDKSHHRCS